MDQLSTICICFYLGITFVIWALLLECLPIPFIEKKKKKKKTFMDYNHAS
jgi:hypothetical protein